MATRTEPTERITDPYLSLAAKYAGIVAESFRVIDEDRGWRPVGPKEKDPAQWSEEELAAARQDSRNLCKLNEFAIGATKNRTNYTVGTGFGCTVEPAEGRDTDDPVVAQVREFVQAFAELNNLSRLGRQAVKMCDRDGDGFLRLYPSNGVPEARWVYAAWVQTPPGRETDPSVSHGIEFAKRTGGEIDQETPVAYHLKKSLADEEYDRIPEAEIVHVRLDDDPELPRGVPTFYPAIGALLRCEDILRAMGTTAVARAKLALLWRTKNVSKRAEDNLRSRLTEHTQTDAAGRQIPASVENMPFGSVLRIPEDDDVQFPSANVGAADMVESLQAQLRAVAAMLNMPEWMFTGRAVEKFANAFVAEGPTTKEMQAVQEAIGRKLVSGSLGVHASLVWKAIRMAVAGGLLPADAFDAVTLKPILPTLIVRNQQEEASVNNTYVSQRIKSRETVQLELGLDPEVERARMDADPYPPVPPKPVPDGGTVIGPDGLPVANPAVPIT
jgi:hypothetical protein